MWDQTHDEKKSQGWTALVLDTNGNGKRDAYLDSEQKVLTAPSGESLGPRPLSAVRSIRRAIHASMPLFMASPWGRMGWCGAACSVIRAASCG